MSETIIMLLWFFKLDSDKWISKWTAAISFSSRFCPQNLLGVLSDTATKITPTLIVHFHSLGPGKGAFTKIKQGLTKSFYTAWKLLLYPFIFPLFPRRALTRRWYNTKHPALIPTRLVTALVLTDMDTQLLSRKHQDLRHCTDPTSSLIPSDY